MGNEKKKDARIPAKKPTVLIICEKRMTSNNKDYAEQLGDVLSGACKVLSIVNFGENVWKSLLENTHDIVIVSHMLPDMDAVSLISMLRSSSYYADTLFFLCTNKVTKSVKTVCAENNINDAYSFSTPIEMTAANIIDKYEQHRQHIIKAKLERLLGMRSDPQALADIEAQMLDLEYDLDKVLTLLGFRSELKGMSYIKILLKMRLCGLEHSLSDMYECIAIYSETKGAAVEKAVRYAIEQAWMKGDLYMQYFLFGNTTDEAKGKPTNSEFVARLTEHLRLKIFGNSIYMD
ncbi:MAG: hypothetical protein J1E60_04645 [Christensenellaceae bacterium]|nr:hypothetical protein [Christensenellaceae bacterium]